MHRIQLVFILLVIILLSLAVISLSMGATPITLHDTLVALLHPHANVDKTTILLNFRLPKTLTALLAGMALAICGLLVQTVFRNPLAGPDVLGVTSGAGLGVAILVLGFSWAGPTAAALLGSPWAIAIAAWAGAALALTLLFVVALRVHDIMTVLVLGILFSGAVGAIVGILQYASHESMLKAFIVWTLGSVGSLTWAQMPTFSLSILLGTSLAVISLKSLDVLLLGPIYAQSSGLSVRRARLLIFASASLLAGSVTAFCGPIAFIGIAAPHVARIALATGSHRILLPASALVGACLLLLGDILTQLPSHTTLLPINAVTSLLGIPVVVYIVYRNFRFSDYS